jgi:hypothetical protein
MCPDGSASRSETQPSNRKRARIQLQDTTSDASCVHYHDETQDFAVRSHDITYEQSLFAAEQDPSSSDCTGGSRQRAVSSQTEYSDEDSEEEKEEPWTASELKISSTVAEPNETHQEPKLSERDARATVAAVFFVLRHLLAVHSLPLAALQVLLRLISFLFSLFKIVIQFPSSIYMFLKRTSGGIQKFEVRAHCKRCGEVNLIVL